MITWLAFKSDVLSSFNGLRGESDPVEFQRVDETLPIDVRVTGPNRQLHVTDASMYLRYLRTIAEPVDKILFEDLLAASDAGRLREWADANEPVFEQTKALLDDDVAPPEARLARQLFLTSLAACSLTATWWQLGFDDDGLEHYKVAMAHWSKAAVELGRVEAIIGGFGPEQTQ